MGEKGKLHQAQEIQRELNDKGLSRRAFLDRLKVLGVGFGAAAMLGVRDADADIRSDASVSLKSTNPDLNNIIEEGRQDLLGAEGDGPKTQMAYGRYSRGYSRGYSRHYARYSRHYARYARYSRHYARYSRYSRHYARYARYSRHYARYSRY
jgi:hypothetical protein